MDVFKTVESNKVVLVVMSSTGYSKVSGNLAKKLSKGSVCYVTLNKTYDSLKEAFKKKKVNLKNIVFIDAISKTIKDVADSAEGCYYVSSAGALTELSLVISKFIRHKFDYIVFDSITNLLTYRKKAVVEKFIISLIHKIKVSKTKGVFLALSIKEQEDLVKKASTYVDECVEVGK